MVHLLCFGFGGDGGGGDLWRSVAMEKTKKIDGKVWREIATTAYVRGRCDTRR